MTSYRKFPEAQAPFNAERHQALHATERAGELGDTLRAAGRPTRQPGISTGRLEDGWGVTELNVDDIDARDRPGEWVGPRADMYLPYLFMRANAADLGARPIVNGVPFWESPDIFILSGVDPAEAPPIPPELGQIALAKKDNTIYAHVWNFGNAAANEVVVEFYWVNPTLGVSPESVQSIGQTFVSLGAKGSTNSHKVVKCPTSWKPTFANGGHECLLVRVWDNPLDLLGEPEFDASVNRHVAQRNIHVVQPGANMHEVLLRAGAPAPIPAMDKPLSLTVGPLFGAPAKVEVKRINPKDMHWLQLHTGQRDVFPVSAPPTGEPTLSPPTTTPPTTTINDSLATTGGATQQDVDGDDKHIAFSTSDQAPGPGQAHVYRITASQNGAIFGGYTVVILG